MRGQHVNSLKEILSSAFSGVERENVIALVDFVQSSGVERLCVLRSGNNLTVLRSQTVSVTCRFDCAPLEERTPVLSEPAQEPSTVPRSMTLHLFASQYWAAYSLYNRLRP